jgi:hypothetical protein
MTPREQRATAGTMAPQNRLQNKSYRDRSERSIAKLKKEIGELLLCLQALPRNNQQQECWMVFDARLRRYVDRKMQGAML